MSTLQVGTIKSKSSAAPVFQNSSGTEIGSLPKMWIFFDMNAGSIKDSLNVSSITDHNTGQYSVTYTTAISNDDYASLITTQAGLTAYGYGTGDNSQTTSALVNIFTIVGSNGTTQDASCVSVAIFGDQ